MLQVHDEIVVVFNKKYTQWFPDRIKQIMILCANKYLEGGVKMDAQNQIKPHWTK
jgi:hypothetical protein